jgi:hypothetical protein
VSAATLEDLPLGVHDHVSNAAYHADPAVGSTTLRNLLDPAKAGLFDATGHVHMEETEAMQWGTLLHSIVLESDDTQAVVLPFKEFRTAEAKAAKAEVLAAGNVPLKPHEWPPLAAARDAVLAHPFARALLTGGVSEQTLISEDATTGLRLKARPDHRTAFIADLKTCRDANPSVVERRTIPDYGYQQAAAWYQQIVADTVTNGEHLPFYLVNVEKTNPYRVSVVEIGDQYLEDGRARNRRALDLYAHGIQTGEWPTWPDTYTAEPPLWLTAQTEELTEGA